MTIHLLWQVLAYEQRKHALTAQEFPVWRRMQLVGPEHQAELPPCSPFPPPPAAHSTAVAVAAKAAAAARAAGRAAVVAAVAVAAATAVQPRPTTGRRATNRPCRRLIRGFR